MGNGTNRKEIMNMKKTSSISDRLAKLKEKMASVDVGGESGFWRPESGKPSTIRILPPVGGMDYFFQEVGRHYSLPDGSVEVCPNFTTSGTELCPICELVRQLYKGSSSDRALAGKLRCSKSFWMNVVVRDKDDPDGIEASGPYIWTPGTSVFTQLMALINNPDYGDISDPSKEGVDIVVERRGEGLKTEYFITTRRKSSPLHDNQDTVDEWLDSARDLSFVMLTNDPDEDEELASEHKVVALPYDRLVEKYNLDEGAGVLIEKLEEDMKEEQENERPVPSIRRRPTEATNSSGDVKEEIRARIRSRRR